MNDVRAVLADAADHRMQEDMYGDMTGVMMTNLVSSSPGHQTDIADAKKKREYSSPYHHSTRYNKRTVHFLFFEMYDCITFKSMLEW